MSWRKRCYWSVVAAITVAGFVSLYELTRPDSAGVFHKMMSIACPDWNC